MRFWSCGNAITSLCTLQVEATKFTEVGFHGRDVDQVVLQRIESHCATMTLHMIKCPHLL